MSAGANQDRARVYGALARLFRPPDESSLDALRGRDLAELHEALARLGVDSQTHESLERLAGFLEEATLEDLRRSYQNTFEPSGGPRCQPNETAHTAETPQHALTKNFELADIAGFYRAFGVEVKPETERPDHIAAELEFMHLLATKELVANGEDQSGEHIQICRDAQRAFLRDHLGRWTTKLGRRLEEAADGPFYAAAGEFMSRFIPFDAALINPR